MVKICFSHQIRHCGPYLHNFNDFFRPSEPVALIYFFNIVSLPVLDPVRLMFNFFKKIWGAAEVRQSHQTGQLTFFTKNLLLMYDPCKLDRALTSVPDKIQTLWKWSHCKNVSLSCCTVLKLDHLYSPSSPFLRRLHSGISWSRRRMLGCGSGEFSSCGSCARRLLQGMVYLNTVLFSVTLKKFWI